MKRALLLSPLFLFTIDATAQCTGAVPANATVITSSTAGAVPGSNKTFWVCGTAFQQIFTGSNNQFYIGSGAFVSINGGSNTVRCKGNVMLGIFGSNNTIYAQSTGAISDQGSNNTVNVCGTGGVVFTYGSAPANGCTVVGIEEDALNALPVTYQPASEQLMVTSPGSPVRAVRVVDMRGSEVAHARSATTPIALPTLMPGAYVVQVVTDHGTVTRRFVK